MRLLLIAILFMSSTRAFALHQPAPIDDYSIHADGGLIYDPLRREAAQTGQLDHYASAPAVSGRMDLGGAILEYSVPRKVGAYDVVPIPYTLTVPESGNFPVAVQAVAFQEKERAQGEHLYDLALPNNIDLDVEYLGSITAHLDPEIKHVLTPDLSDTPTEYPNFRRKPMVRSGVAEAGDLVWFKFNLINTGDTILSAEGYGGSQLFPELLRKDRDGDCQPYALPYNRYYRNTKYWYPGESWEPWIIFRTPTPEGPYEHYGLEPGEYIIRLRLTYRAYMDDDAAPNYWDGPVVFTYDHPIVIEEEPRHTEVAQGSKRPSPGDYDDKLTRFIHTFEEFMTAFDVHQNSAAFEQNTVEGTLYLQVAPWTRHVVLKLIGTDPVSITTASIPVDVDDSTMDIQLPDTMPHSVIGEDGKRWPVFMSQTMADMRGNVQLGPFPEHHIPNRMREMKDLGVNVLATTSMPWMYDHLHEANYNYPGDAWRYALDVARAEGFEVEAWGQYPFDRGTIGDIASWITGKDYSDLITVASGYGDGAAYVSHLAPRLPEANAQVLLYHFRRWGDLFHQSESGMVPISVGEDTRGWMRDDVNVRYPIGEVGTKAFRQWALERYGSLEAINHAWGSAFAQLEDIDPETHLIDAHGHRWTYHVDKSHPFHDWNAAVEDYDIWRTEVRVKNYLETVEVVEKEIPDPGVVLRTEGGNALIGGIDPGTPNAHFRHAYYSQRRVGAIAEILAETNAVAFHSDYTTIPYTPTELRRIAREGVAQGIVPAYLPYYNDMRDVAINDRYGLDYTTHYNISEPKKGYMIHVLAASYPWHRIMFEEGAIPGILWEDYECAGFVTETQKREMRHFQQKLTEAFDTPEGERLRSADIQRPSQKWRKGSQAKRSYYGPEEK